MVVDWLVHTGVATTSAVAGAAIKHVYEWSKSRHLKAFFGQDIFKEFFIVHDSFEASAELAGPWIGREITDANTLKADNALITGLGTTRAVWYLAINMSQPVKGSIFKAKTEDKCNLKIRSQAELDADFNISFASLGLQTNCKSADVFGDPANTIVKYENGRFLDAQSGKILSGSKPDCDYGLILRIRPADYPKRVWLCCGGTGQWGTSGSAWYLANYWSHIRPAVKKYPNIAVITETVRGKDDTTVNVWNSLPDSMGSHIP